MHKVKMNKKTIITLSMFLLVILFSISTYAQTEGDNIDKGVSSMMFDVPDTSQYQSGNLDKLISDMMFDKDELAFHPDFKIRINEIYKAAGLSHLYPGVAKDGGTGGLIWIVLITAGAVLFFFIKNKISGKEKKGKPKKSKKEKRILNELSNKFKNISLRLIDLFTGKHFREQERAMQRIIDIGDEFHKLAVHKDIYYVIEKLEKEPLLDQVEDTVAELIKADEIVIHLIDKLLKLNKNQLTEFKQNELSKVLDPKINLLYEYETIQNDLKEIKANVMTRVIGYKKEGERGLYRIIKDIDLIRRVLKKPIDDEKAERIDALVKNIDKETQEIKNALIQTRDSIGRFEGRVKREILKEGVFIKESDSISELAGVLGYDVDALKGVLKQVDINQTMEENLEKLKVIKLDKEVSDAADEILNVVDRIKKRNEKGTIDASLKMYLSVGKEVELNDIHEDEIKQILMFCDVWKRIKPTTKVLNLGK